MTWEEVRGEEQMENYYGILGTPPDASQEDIKTAYREQAKKYHPDTTRGDKEAGEAKFKEINEAYEVLSDLSKRKKYDSERVSFQSVQTQREISLKDAYTGTRVIGVVGSDGRRYSYEVDIPAGVEDGYIASVWLRDGTRLDIKVKVLPTPGFTRMGSRPVCTRLRPICRRSFGWRRRSVAPRWVASSGRNPFR